MSPFDGDQRTFDRRFAEITAGWDDEPREPRDRRDSALLLPMVIASWLIVWGAYELIAWLA